MTSPPRRSMRVSSAVHQRLLTIAHEYATTMQRLVDSLLQHGIQSSVSLDTSRAVDLSTWVIVHIDGGLAAQITALAQQAGCSPTQYLNLLVAQQLGAFTVAMLPPVVITIEIPRVLQSREVQVRAAIARVVANMDAQGSEQYEE